MTAAAVPPPKPAPVVPTAPVGPATMSAAPVLDDALFTADAPAFKPEVVAALATPVEPEWVERRARFKGDEEGLLYVPWVHYQRVLLKAFGPAGYKLVPRGVPRTEGNATTWLKALFVRAPGEIKFQFIKEAKGECKNDGGMTPGNSAEGAHSDALVKCCKELGIFMELFDPNWRRAWERDHEKGGQPRPNKGRPAPVMNPAPVVNDVPDAAPPSGEAATGAADTGEAASTEAKQAVIAQWKRLQWKAGFIKMWIAEVFGLQVTDVRRAAEQFTQKQAEAAYLLLNVHGTPTYDRLVGQWKETGALS